MKREKVKEKKKNVREAHTKLKISTENHVRTGQNCPFVRPSVRLFVRFVFLPPPYCMRFVWNFFHAFSSRFDLGELCKFRQNNFSFFFFYSMVSILPLKSFATPRYLLSFISLFVFLFFFLNFSFFFFLFFFLKNSVTSSFTTCLFWVFSRRYKRIHIS